jgi:hypothetical protein
MIDHLAPKFNSTFLARTSAHEPRAAFLLNRFSETLPVLYATHAAQFVLSCDPEDAVGRSFYEFIDEGYLLGAINAIERAKENDSIAYLRLLWKRRGPWMELEDSDDDMEDDEDEDDEDEDDEDEDDEDDDEDDEEGDDNLLQQQHQSGIPIPQRRDDRLEVECLVSSSSDGLIVVVRCAPPLEGHPFLARPPGIFASPWATAPLAPYSMTPPPRPPVTDLRNDSVVENIPSLPGPSNQEVMESIRDVSVFVWSIAMLNDDVSQNNASNLVDGEMYPEEENVLPDHERR